MWLLYYTGIYLFVLGVRISALWNKKSQQWLEGRKNESKKSENLLTKQGFRIWFHVASLGEFEQAKPVIEKIKLLRPQTEIILSFFSPSGYNLRRDYAFATVLYLPADLPGNANKWLTLIKPDLAVFVKYDLWPGYLKALAKKEIPSILISANWLPGFKWNSWSLPITQNLLKGFQMIFLQRGEHIALFQKMGFKNVTIAGDTRIDRCLNLINEVETRIPKELLHAGIYDLVAGSTWPADEELIIDTIQKLKLKTIIAPHDISPVNIERLIKNFNFPHVKLSELKEPDLNASVLIVDNVGLLSVLYSLGRIAYVGGGFGKGIHNTLEPMANAKPVIFGPHYDKFPEAVDMISRQGAWTVNSKEEFRRVLNPLLQPGIAEEAGKNAFRYLKEHSGATDIVTNHILASIPHKAEA